MYTLPQFRARFPEFQSADEILVQTFLDAAASRIDPTVWGSMADEGHAYLTAHLLALAPNGQFARLVVTSKNASTPGSETTYGVQYEKLKKQAACAIRVF